jgi:diguanylate cyclase (GGDEF)-like protein/PAS domain S-box-containing protein
VEWQLGSDGDSAFRALHGLVAQVTAAHTLEQTLMAVVDGVVAGVGFDVAALNTLGPDGRFHAVAVAGPDEARDALLGQSYEREVFEKEFAAADIWGTTLHFVPHDRLVHGEVIGWVPPQPATPHSPEHEAWHPLDALYVPLCAASGDLLGVLSVDLPTGRRRPSALQQDLLEIFGAHTGLALEKARLAEDLRREGERLRVSEASFRLAFDGAAVGMSILGLAPGDIGRLLAVNPEMCQLAGREAHELVGRPVQDITHPDDLEGDMQAVQEAIASRADRYQREKRYVRPDGSVIWVSVTASLIWDSAGRAVYAITHVQDVTAERLAAQDLHYRATHDPLTGLANRAVLEERLNALSALTPRPSAAVIFCDLDGFKDVNDQHGHLVGDQVLRVVSGRFARLARHDGDVVARLGGDEFVMVVPNVTRAQAAALVARVEDAVAEPIAVRGLTLRVSVSAGIAMLSEAADPEGLLTAADLAMYAAKGRTAAPHAPPDGPGVGESGGG